MGFGALWVSACFCLLFSLSGAKIFCTSSICPLFPKQGLCWGPSAKGNSLCLPRGNWQMGGTQFDSADSRQSRGLSLSPLGWFQMPLKNWVLDFQTLPQRHAAWLCLQCFFFCKGTVKAKKPWSKAIHWLVQDVVAGSQLCSSSESHHDNSQFLSIYNPSSKVNFIASVIHSHWFMNTQAIRGILPNYSSSFLIDLCSLPMDELEKESSFLFHVTKQGDTGQDSLWTQREFRPVDLPVSHSMILCYTVRALQFVIRLPCWPQLCH